MYYNIFNESGPLHETLNPKLFDSNMHLLSDARETILKIVKSFEDWYVQYKSEEDRLKVLDINLVGSNASFNYSDHSDLDVSVVINFNEVTPNKELADDYLHCKKNEFNETYHPTIRGIPVELYIQDVKSVGISNGIYSVKYDKWIKKPVKIDPPKVDITDDVAELTKIADNLLEKKNLGKVKAFLNYLYLMRRNSLIVSGEYGRGNLVYKEMRNNGYLDKIHDAINELTSKDLSIEESYNFFDY